MGKIMGIGYFKNNGDRNNGDRNNGDRNNGDRNNGDRNNGDKIMGIKIMGIGYFITTKIQSISNPTQTQLKYLHVQKTANHLFLSLLSTQPSRKRNHPNPNHQPKRQS